ncbi:MAG: hypothetical protein ACRDF4_03100 [Rhabdochlamydiaceae bacterium]
MNSSFLVIAIVGLSAILLLPFVPKPPRDD